MADQRKMSISFAKEHKEVLELLQEHFKHSGVTNRSSAIIALLQSALTRPDAEGESSSWEYELDRLSAQLDEVCEEVGKLREKLSEPASRAGAEELSEIHKTLSRLHDKLSSHKGGGKEVKDILEARLDDFRCESATWHEKLVLWSH